MINPDSYEILTDRELGLAWIAATAWRREASYRTATEFSRAAESVLQIIDEQTRRLGLSHEARERRDRRESTDAGRQEHDNDSA